MVPQLLIMLLESKRLLCPQTFWTLFMKVESHLMGMYQIYILDRIPIREHVLDMSLWLTPRAEFSLLTKCRHPSPLTAWLLSWLCILRKKSLKV